jgi:hypothetical protein
MFIAVNINIPIMPKTFKDPPTSKSCDGQQIHRKASVLLTWIYFTYFNKAKTLRFEIHRKYGG